MSGPISSFIVVDDFILQGAALQKMLARIDDRLDYLGQAVNGEEGLALARRVRPSLMFVDIEMPGLDGLSMAKMISEELPGTRLVILSAHDDFSYVQQALRIRVDDYLLKPVASNCLAAVVSRLRAAEPAKAASPGSPLPGWAAELSAAILSGDGEALNARIAHLRRTGEVVSPPGNLRGEQLFELALLVVRRLEQEERSAGSIRSFYQRFLQSHRANCPAEQRFGEFEELLLSCFNAFRRCDSQSPNSHIHLAKSWMLEHLGEAITLQSIADRVFLSPTHLSRLFKRQEGITISEYLLRERLAMARRLLASTGDNIETIACRCGYDKVNSFWKMFKKEEGISPGQYREKHRSAGEP